MFTVSMLNTLNLQAVERLPRSLYPSIKTMCAPMLGCVGATLSHTHFCDVNSIKIQNLETASSENTTFESLRRLPLLNQFIYFFRVD